MQAAATAGLHDAELLLHLPNLSVADILTGQGAGSGFKALLQVLIFHSRWNRVLAKEHRKVLDGLDLCSCVVISLATPCCVLPAADGLTDSVFWRLGPCSMGEVSVCVIYNCTPEAYSKCKQ